jgi:F0F1-type ATP synthase assembly protein I
MNIPVDDKGVRRAGWGATVGTAVALQWVVILTLSAGAWILGGADDALSLLGGGTAVALPNTLLALWLTLRMRRAGRLTTATMLLGELLKLGLTMALLVLAVVELKPAVSWLALIIGVIGALKAQWLALWFTRKF